MKTGTSNDISVIGIGLIEDDHLFRAQMERWINQEQGFKCVGSFGDAETSLPSIVKSKPDVIVLDFGLPGMKGGEFCRLVKERVSGIRVLVLTGLPHHSVIFESLMAGADGFLDKQDYRFPQDQLIQEIREVHAGRHPLSARARTLVLEEFRKTHPKVLQGGLLSERELEIASLINKGYTDSQTAKHLGISIFTVYTHVRNLCEKLHAHNRREAVYKLWGIQ